MSVVPRPAQVATGGASHRSPLPDVALWQRVLAVPKPLRYFLERDAQYRVAQTLTAAALFFRVTASVITLAAFNRRDEPEGESDHDPS